MQTAVSDFSILANLIQALSSSSLSVGIAAPSVFLSELCRKTSNVLTLFAQNAHWEKEGAFTGEISVPMLKSIHVNGSLIGHSERRQFFGETNETAGKRVGALLKQGMKSVLCIGESLQERDSGLLEQVLSKQIAEALNATGLKSAHDFVGSNPLEPLFSIAYEPVWAIGTGKSATEKEAQQAHEFIRSFLAQYFSREVSEKIQLLYGGSVKVENINKFISCADIDGALVGGASLNPQQFAQLCENAI
jgi:triosephosphate isomerase